MPSGAEMMFSCSKDEWNNCEFHILCTEKDLGVFSEQLRDDGYIIHHIYNSNFIIKHILTIQLFINLKPDIVKIERESEEVFYAFDAYMSRVKKIIRTVHSSFLFNGFLRFRRKLTRFISREIFGTKYVAISDSVYDNESTRFNNRPYSTIYNWCDETKFSFISNEDKETNKEKRKLKKCFVLVSVGNCHQIKNHFYILKGIERILKKYPEANVKYFHIGEGECLEKEKGFCKKIGIKQNVEFVGYSNPAEYLSIADVFCMPSKYEGFGIAALEALRSGITCVFTDVIGLKDFKKIESDNIVYSKDDVDDYSIKLLEVYDHFLKGTIRNSKELSDSVTSKYSMKKSVKKYIELFNK